MLAACSMSSYADTFTSDQTLALRAINYYRLMAGLPNARLDSSLCRAAQNHADYRIANTKVRESPHYETPGMNGYTGKDPFDRMRAAGYQGLSFGECLSTGVREGPESVDGLIRVPYHRVQFIGGDKLDVGVGVGRAPGKPTVWVFDLSGSANPVSVWPPDKSTGVPPVGDVNESPNPMAIHADKVNAVGYVVTVGFDQPNNQLIDAHMETLDGQPVAVYLNHPGNDPNCGRCILMIPTQPLRSNTQYQATVKVKTHDGNIIDKAWTFKTGTPLSNFGTARKLATKVDK